MQPLISIITITYNSEKTLEDTIKSVINQNYPRLEYIIIDGGSTDSTLNIVNKYSEYVTLAISEPDKGISDAFNKGILNSTGEIIGIINSDDILAPNALNNLVEVYNPNIDIYRGNQIICQQDTGFQCVEKPALKFSKIPMNAHISHPSTFVRKDAYNKLGTYDIKCKCCMDLDLLMRFYQSGARFFHVDKELAYFQLGGYSSTKMTKERKRELEYILKKNGSNIVQRKIYIILLDIKLVIKWVLNHITKDLSLKIRYRKMNK